MNPAEFISDYSNNNTFVSSDLDSSGYGIYKTSTNQNLLDSGEFGKNSYYESCDETTPCCDNCVSYPNGNCISINMCRWALDGDAYGVSCSFDHMCSTKYTSNTLLPSEFYNRELSSAERKLWKRMKNKKELTVNTTKKKLFVPELHTCMWFDCSSKSPHNPCKKYTEC